MAGRNRRAPARQNENAEATSPSGASRSRSRTVRMSVSAKRRKSIGKKAPRPSPAPSSSHTIAALPTASVSRGSGTYNAPAVHARSSAGDPSVAPTAPTDGSNEGAGNENAARSGHYEALPCRYSLLLWLRGGGLRWKVRAYEPRSLQELINHLATKSCRYERGLRVSSSTPRETLGRILCKKINNPKFEVLVEDKLKFLCPYCDAYANYHQRYNHSVKCWLGKHKVKPIEYTVRKIRVRDAEVKEEEEVLAGSDGDNSNADDTQSLSC
ncbi:hypothetical protein FGB62_37g49 [Gracilaria domingensis]|nr:hypothetical protein FGB62_37g49 [Gracilaria domingensis]